MSTTLFDEMAQYIDRTRAILKEGRVSDLEELAPLAARLNEEASALTHEERARYADRLDEIVQGLIALEEELRGQKVEIGRELQGLSTAKKAAVAYRTTEASDNYKPEE